MGRSTATNRLVRLIRLLDLLSTKTFMRADDLCLKLQVSKRTVFRDLAILQEAGVALRCDPIYGYVLDGGVKLVRDELASGEVVITQRRSSLA